MIEKNVDSAHVKLKFNGANQRMYVEDITGLSEPVLQLVKESPYKTISIDVEKGVAVNDDDLQRIVRHMTELEDIEIEQANLTEVSVQRLLELPALKLARFHRCPGLVRGENIRQEDLRPGLKLYCTNLPDY